MKNKDNKKIIKIWLEKFICVVSCITLLFPIFSPIVLAEATKLRNSTYAVDPDTTDDYINQLITPENGSRYAGRVWSDKSVFLDKIELNEETDGYNGTITNNSDFLHVFSVLGSSQRINTYSNSPIDAIFLLDMSGSMAADLQASETGHTHATDDSGRKEHLAHSRMQQVLDSMNSAINTLMELNDTNRVTVVAYGATAEVLMPLAHYKKAENEKNYLTVSNLTGYFSKNDHQEHYSATGAGAYTVTATAQKANENNNNTYENYTKSVRNNYPKFKKYENPKLSEVSRTATYVGFNTNMQAGIYAGFKELYDNLKTSEDVSYKYKTTDSEVTVPRIPVAFVMTDGASNFALKANTVGESIGDEWYNLPEVKLNNADSYDSNFTKYRSEDNYDFIGGEAVILDILLTASYMKSKIQNKYTELLRKANLLNENESADFKVHTISVDTPTADWQPPRVYATLNPKQYFNDIGNPSFNKPENGDNQMYNNNIINAYKLFLQWQQKDIEIKFCDSGHISNKQCQNSTQNRTIKFNRLKDEENDEVKNKDVIDNIYYNDDFYDISATDLEETFKNLITNINGEAFTPVGGTNEFGSDDSLTYMDPIGEYMEVKDNAITLNDNKTYDMALLLFGNMYGIEKEAVYDPLFNQKHLVNDKFASGWYDSNGTKKDSGSWENGDTYYLSDENVKDYITDDDAINSHNKKMIIYRIDTSSQELEKMQVNKSYGDINQVYYKLKDIKILIDVDETGKEKLYLNLPTTALPLQTVTIQMAKDNENVESYKTNLDDKKLSTPLRLFYEVGLTDNIKINDGKDVDLDKIDDEYLKKNTTEDEYLKFYSNYYSATTYDGYTADTQDDARTKGDALLTLSPNINNRYYIFQKNLKIYSHAYIIGEDGEVEEENNPLLFEGADFDGEYEGKTENNRPDSTAQDSIKEAFEKDELNKGDIIFLSGDTVPYGTDPSSDAFYYFAIDYFIPTEGGKGKQVQYVVARRGSEFGSGIAEHPGAKLPKGDFLSWIDASGTNQETFDFSESIPENIKSSGNWVLATKIGGLRIGDLHQSILRKEENTTNTSKSYYLPIIADDPSTVGSDAILDAYLGNNGLLTYKIEKWTIPEAGSIGNLAITTIGIILIIISSLLYRRNKKRVITEIK